MRRATVIGSGPNGLTAAITLAKAGIATTVLEAQPTIGGGARSAALTLPGFIHDVCSAVHPMALSSPAMAAFPLKEHGLEWIHPSAPLAHTMADGSAVMLERSLDQTAERLGCDGPVYRRIMSPFVRHWDHLKTDLLAPLHIPQNPYLMARFGLFAFWPAASAARHLFKTEEARALFAGLAAHSFLPMEKPVSSAVGLVLAIAGHAVGWPIPRGGSQKISDALSSYFQSLGGQIITGQTVRSIDEIKDADAVLCDVTPKQLLVLAGHRLPFSYVRQLEAYRYGPGVYKMDWALSGPIPWKDSNCARAGTVHIGGSLEDVSASERAPWEGRVHERPFILLAQPSMFDASRAPAGQQAVWAYCHVPNGSVADLSAEIESQIERVAPGFRTKILARHGTASAELERYNANLVGGDINGGAQDLGQLFFRPTRHLYRTPRKGLYLCSSSTPPGGGVHGMCGYYAACAVLEDI